MSIVELCLERRKCSCFQLSRGIVSAAPLHLLKPQQQAFSPGKLVVWSYHSHSLLGVQIITFLSGPLIFNYYVFLTYTMNLLFHHLFVWFSTSILCIYCVFHLIWYPNIFWCFKKISVCLYFSEDEFLHGLAFLFKHPA